MFAPIVFVTIFAFCWAANSSAAPFAVLTSPAEAGGITATWLTNVSTAISVVEYSVDQKVWTRAAGTQVQYIADSVFVHHAVIPGHGLASKEPLHYKVGDGSAMSDVYTVMVPPMPGTKGPFSMVFFGDNGIDSASDLTRAALAKAVSEDPSIGLFYSLGDHTYADDRNLNAANYELDYNTFQEQWAVLASSRPMSVLPGNHDVTCRSYGDIDCPSGLNNFTAYRNRWRMPRGAANGPDNMWWSADVGLIHLVAINTETDIPVSGDGPEGHHSQYFSGGFGDQLAWLQADLRKAVANRANVPWIIVTGHRPIFSAHALDYPPGLQFLQRKYLEPIFTQYNIDAYLCGHVHAYERHWPIHNGAVAGHSYVNPNGIVYFVNGASANIEGHTKFTGIYKEPWMNVRNSDDYGFTKAVFANESTVTFTFYNQQYVVKDEFTLVKTRA